MKPVESVAEIVVDLAHAFLADRHPPRHPLVRTSRTDKREPISRQTRIAVYSRDNFRCLWCGTDQDLRLDHFVPWSAGGTNDPDNLRTLCNPCNDKRSNFHYQADETAYRPLPFTYCCIECDPELQTDDPGVGPAFCYWHLRRTVGVRQDSNERITERPPDEEPERRLDPYYASVLKARRIREVWRQEQQRDDCDCGEDDYCNCDGEDGA